MAGTKVPLCGDAEQVATLLDSPEMAALITDLEATRWTGRPGYPIRTMVGLALVKSVYRLPTWTRTVRLVWAMLPLRVRRLPRVALHVDLTILARLACALNAARAVPLAA